MRKGWTTIFLLSALLLAGCGKQTPEPAPSAPAQEPTVPTQTETQAPTLPPMTEAEVLADKPPAILGFLSRGDKVELAGEYDESYYVVVTSDGYGLVDRHLVRTQDQEPFTAWTGYSLWAAKLYDNFFLLGEGTELTSNTKLEILEDLGECYLVKTEDGSGYLPKDKVTKWAPGSGSGGGGSYDGGSSGGGGGSTGQDGGDIDAGALGLLDGDFRVVGLGTVVPQQGTVTGEAEVLADRTPVYLGWFDRGETVQVVDPSYRENPEGYCTVYLKDMYVWVALPLLRQEGEDTYESWEGFAANQPKLYSNFRLTGKPADKPIWVNKAVTVLEDLGDSFLVQVEDEIFYMHKDQVSKTRIPTYSGGGGGGSSGGGGGGSSGPEWTPPKM